MTSRVPRRATRAESETGTLVTRSLAQWRSLDAYVLLGDPGAGKSWAFEDECEAVGGLLLKARNVVAGITPTDLMGRTVFIDGLDEVRAGSIDQRAPFEKIRKWLYDQGCPRFRLSCREADWLGHNDRLNLQDVAPGGSVIELHLEPLSDEDISSFLASRQAEVPDAQAFLATTTKAGLLDLLRNPLLLDLMAKIASSGEMPRTRLGIYEAASRQLASEHNAEHLAALPPVSGEVEKLLDAAGLLCALLLLTGLSGITQRRVADAAAIALPDIPSELRCDAAANALRSKLFATEQGLLTPRHRSIAEYLAGRALARRIAAGLPLGRVMALMQGIDGLPVDPLRGLWAWLAVHHAPGRARLIALDPLGFILNADAAALSTDERLSLLYALRDAAERDPWFRNAAWVSHPFGPLATADMAATYDALLRDPHRERGHLSFVDCLFDALQHGEPIPALAPTLATWVIDGNVDDGWRTAAYEAWKHCTGFEAVQALAWLQSVHDGLLRDDEDCLYGALLSDLYPKYLPPEKLVDYWHRPKRPVGAHWHFWGHDLWRKTPPEAFATLANAWVRTQPPLHGGDASIHDARELTSRLLAAALEQAGDEVDDNTLYDWLGMCLDEHGFSRLEDKAHAVQAWLADRPARMKAVMALGLARTQPDAEGRWHFWHAESRLHGTQRPHDWLFWLLEQAAQANTPAVSEECFSVAANAVISPVSGLNTPSIEQIGAWVRENQGRWPEAVHWQQRAWTVRLDDWRGDQARRQLRAKTEQTQRDTQRRQDLLPHLQSLLDGSAPLGLLYHVAVAHEHGFVDVRGSTPVERVRNYLLSDDATAQAVISALPHVLERKDLPTVDEELKREAKGKQHYIRPAALLAARIAYEADPSSVLSWPRELAERLTIYYLADGTGDMPGWYRSLVQQRPDWVAPLLVRYASAKLKRKTNQFIAGLWALAKEADHAELTRLALPPLLETFPLRASEQARRTLNQSLLPALQMLDDAQAQSIVRAKLHRQDEMDAAQRLCWLVADLPYRPTAAQDLALLVGRNERRAVQLGAAFHEQGSFARVMHRLPPDAIKRLIEVLAPITGPESRHRAGLVTDRHYRGDTIHSLLSALSSNPDQSAREALLHLSQAPGLRTWQTVLQYSLRTQAATLREASYQTPSMPQVAQTLANTAPANPADLRALAIQHLQDLQDEWRGTNTFFLKLFWRDEGRTPKIENDCRDLLLDALRTRLKPLNVDVGREQSAARDKRMDACAVFMRDGHRISLPVEVKKENNEQLWTAWHDQLQRLYVTDPDAKGIGLYLVLWFGVSVRTHPEGRKLRDSAELRDALMARIPPQDRHRLAVQVLDLSWPEG